jgi:hypothetical protein
MAPAFVLTCRLPKGRDWRDPEARGDPRFNAARRLADVTRNFTSAERTTASNKRTIGRRTSDTDAGHFFPALAFKAAVGLALLGAVLIGLFTVNSSWIAFNASNTVAAAQAELEKKRDEIARTESNLVTLERQSEETTGKYNLVKT